MLDAGALLKRSGGLGEARAYRGYDMQIAPR